jgi:penicillin-binding protein 2
VPSPENDLTSGAFPPGSTFKPFTAAAAWNAGFIAPGSERDCSSDYIEPSNHDRSHHVWHNYGPGVGMIDLPMALTISCDTFFYRLGDQFYGESYSHPLAFQNTLHQFGYGKVPKGYDLLSASGNVPTPYWKKHYSCFKAGTKKTNWVNSCGYPNMTPDQATIDQTWLPGDDVQMAIGQGYLLVTPLQEAVAYSAIANGGKIVRPHVVSEILDPANNNAVVRRTNTSPVRNLHLSQEYLDEIYAGLHGATHDSTGTSSAVFGGYTGHPFDVWGKTGTAETGQGKPNDAWWSGWATNGKKSLVVVAMIQNGGHGGVSAAPAALQVFQSYFGQKVTNVTPNSSADTSR